MNRFTVKLPSYTIGENVLLDIGNVLQQYGNRVLVVGGKMALDKTKDEIEKTLIEGNFHIIDFMWYGGECTYKNMDAICQKAVTEKANIIIGVGGGKALDTAKGASEKLGIPIITVPTIAATCAATTSLAVVYNEHGDFDSLFQLSTPPIHIFMDMNVIANAPVKYLWAGIGDTIAKYYEVDISSRGKILSHSASMGKELSIMCVDPLIEYGKKALEDSKKGEPSFSLEQIILNNIISTGIVAMLVGAENNGAIAHGLFYGLTLLEQIEKHHLHGEVVAYGVLVLLMMDHQKEVVDKLYPFYKSVNLPTCLNDIDVINDRNYLECILKKAVVAPDTLKMPYKVTEDMLFHAIQNLEMLKC
ncbi:MAG TPA: iron-containing alcohol dehydrogenase family protein [Candidatus Paceibacterota bacterium]